MKTIYLAILILLTLTTNLWAQNSFVPVCTADGNIRTLSNYNNQLYLGGWFNSINGVSASKIAKFNGQSFSQVGSGISGTYVDYFGIFNSNLLIGGNFPGSGSVANWNGSTISSMPGISGSTVSGGAVITCSAFFNGEWWVGGDFSFPSKGLAKWNGTSWVGIGAGIDFSINNNFYVNDMIVYNNELYIGGVFTSVNGVAANYIAKFDGTNWTPVGSGLNQWASEFCIYNNELIVGGIFTNAGGLSTNKVAKWNGNSWSLIGNDITGSWLAEIYVFNGELYAGGEFITQSGANNIAKWNGSFWQAVGGGTNGAVTAFCEFNGELYIGGVFSSANNYPCKLAKLAPSLPTPTLNISPTNASICNGQSATLTVNASANNIICAASGLPSSLTTGLVGYWPFCGNANDASGNGNNGTPMNGVALTTDRFGNANSAYNFDGVDDYIYVPYQSSLNSSSISISGWMNASQLGGVRGLVSRWNQSNNPCVNYCTSIDNLTNNFVGASSLYTNTVLFSNNSIQTNQWYHFSYVHNQISGGTLYLNGIAVATNLLSGSICGSNNDLYFGAQINVSSLFRFFAGKLDDIGIWNRALTATEIQQLYTQGQTTYSWSPGGATTPSITVSPSTTTTYTCTITNGGATSTLTQTVTVNPVPTVNAGSDQTVFAGSSVTLAGSGATSYTWDNGVTNNTPFTANATTTYTVTGTSNGCTATDQVLVTVLPAPTVSASASNICAGQSTTLTASIANSTNTCNAFTGSLATGLKGFWPFCGNVDDASGNLNHGAANGATLTTDRFGAPNSAYLFTSGNSNSMLTPIGTNLNPPFSYSLWVLPNSSITYDGESNACINASSYGMMSNSQNWAMIPHHGQNTTLGVGISVGTNSIQAAEHASYILESRMTHTGTFANQFQHIVVVYKTDSSFLYVNGVKVRARSLACQSTPKVLPANIYLGGQYASPNFNGKIDDFGVWNKALTQSEINQLYNFTPTLYSWSNGETTPTITVSPSTTTTYTCTITHGGITTTTSQTITVNPIPTVNAGADQTVFAGSPVTLAGSGATSYTWNNGVTNNTPFTANATTTYTVTGTSNGCSATDQVLVTVLPAPTVTASSSSICAGQSTTLTAASASSGTPCASTGLPSSLTTGLVGYWPFCGNANDESGNGRNGIVSGATLTSDRFGNANSAYNFTGTTNSITIPNSTALLPGSFSVSSWCTIDNLMPSNYDATIIGQLNGSVANDRKWLFGYRSIANERGVSYYLFNNSGNFFLANNYTLNWQPIQSQWYHISWVFESSNTIKTYVNGILHSSVAVNQATFNNIANNVLIKIGNATDVDSPFPLPWNGKIDDVGIWNRVLTLNEIQQLYTQGQTTYSWSPGGATTPTITVSPTTTTTYTCTITQGGATSTLSQTIVVNPLPTVNAGADQTVFAGSSLTLTGSGATTYSWDNGVTNNTPFTANATTTYTVTGTSNGCTATDQVLVTVLPAPTVSASSSTICAGQSTTLTAAVSATSSGTPCTAAGLPSSLTTGLVGYWPFCGNANDASGNGYNGTVNGASLTTDRFGNTNSAYNFNGTTNFISLSNTGNINFAQGITFSGWIRSSDIRMASIVDKETYPSNSGYRLNIRDNSSICAEHGSYGSPYPGAATPFAMSSYSPNIWVFVVGTLNPVTNLNSIYINGSLVNSVAISTMINNNKTIEVGKSTLVQGEYFNGIIDDIGIWNRALTATEIQQLYTQGQTTYTWSPGGATTPSITVSPSTTTTYTCTITNGGATSTLTQTVTVNPVPTVNAGADQTVFAGSSVTLAGSGATSYSWNNGVTNNTPFTASATTTYTLTGTSNGCTATDQVLVTVLPAPTVSASSSTICAGQSTTLTAASASAGTPCAATGLPSSLNTGLVGYWPFCGNANDASGNGNNGTPMNGVALSTDRFGNTNSAYSFDGVNDNIVVPNSQSFQTNIWSISSWFKTSFLGYNRITSKDSPSSPYNDMSLIVLNGNLYISSSLNGQINNPQPICNTFVADNNWHHVVAMRSNGYFYIYIDGLFCSSVIDNFTQLSNSNTFYIGSPSPYPSQYFNGKLDDIGIWNRALTVSEIQQLYTQGQATYSWSPGGATTPSITVSPTTTTTYTCTVTNGGATTTVSQTVVVNAVPTVNAGADQTVFAGNLVTLSGSGAASYSWDNGVTNNVPFAAATTTNYTVTGTTNGCSSTDQVLVTVLPNATISATNTTLCAGQNTTITANVSALSAPCSSSGLAGTLSNGLVGYWPFCGNANDASGNGNNGIVNGATLTTDRFGSANSAYSFDGNGDYVQITNNLFPNQSSYTLNLWVNTNYDTTIELINDRIGNSCFYKYRVLILNGHITLMKYTSTSLEIVSGNSIPLNQWVMVTALYNLSSNIIQIYCNGILNATSTSTNWNSSSNLTNFGGLMGCNTIGVYNVMYGKLDDFVIWNRALTASEIQQLYTQGQATYAWSPGGATTPSITVSPTATTTYTCTVTVNGVSTNVSQTITVNPATNVNAGANQMVCAGTPVTLTATGAATYSWTNGVQNGVPFTPTATQTYTVTGNNAFGCSSTSSVTVTVNPTPIATISYTGSLILCQGSTITLNASAGSSYLWSNGATTQSITVGQAGNYSVQVFNASGCSATSSAVAVVVNPLPAPTIIASGPLTFCQGGSVTLTSTAAQSYLWNNSATSQAINVTASGSYTVTVVNDKGCTGTSAPVLVTVISNPPANVNVIGGTSICAGQSTTLSAPAGYSYIWNTGAQTQFLTVTQSGNYTVQVTNANGCSSVSASILINVNALPNATISASGPTNFCQGQSVMLTAPAASSYLWSNGAQTQSIIVSTAGTYSVTVTGQGGRTATSTPVTVNVYALPSPTIFASGATTFCQGGSVILSAPSGYTYLWTTGSPLQNIIVTNSGTYQVLISNAFGCQIMSNPATVVVNPLPNVNAGMDQTVCAGTPVTLLGSGANSFSWNNGVSNSVPFVPTSTQTYTVTGTNSFGCTAQDQVLVTVNALPTVSAGPNQNICAGQSAVLVGTGAQYYLWSGGVINGNPFTPLATQTYTVTGYNAAGCSNTASTTITVNPLPTAVPGANATITCSNSASGVQIGSAPVAGLQYSWSPTTGLSSPFIANPFANPTTTTNYSLVVTNASGCSNIGQVTVNVNTTPPLALAGPNVEILCSNPNGVSIGAAPISGLTYNWSPSTGLSASNIANPIANPSTTTIYILTVTNPVTGCSANASVTVFVNNTSPTVNAGPDLQVCQGQAITLNGSGLNANTFTWNNGVVNGVPFVPTSTGTYTLTGANSANGCTATDQVVITVNPLPTVSAGNNLQICAGTSVTLNGSGASAYTWNNGITNGVAFTPTATQTYTVTGTNSNGCSNTASVTVTILPGIVVSAGPDQTVCAGTAVTLNGFGANSYSWNNNVSNGVSFIPTTTQTYTVTGTNGNGCAGTDDVTITVVPAPLAQITPAGPLTLCPGGSIILSTGIASTYQWRLNGSNILNATQQNYTATAAGSYTVKVTNANGCSVISAAVQVNLGTTPTASITANGPTAICAGSSVVLTSNAAASYQWLNNGAPIVNQTNQSLTVSAPGSYSVTITNAAGCTATSNIIQVSTAPNPVPVISANGPTAICAGSTLQLSTTATGTLQWYLNGLPIAGATGNSYGATLAGNYSLMVNYASGCQGTSNALTVTLGPPPVPTITPTGPLSLCSGGSVTMTVTAAASYQWKLNGTAIGGAMSQSYTATAPGSYTVTVVYPNGCTATSAATIVNGSSIITPIIVANGSTTICAGASLELIASGSGSFAWNINGNPIIPAVNSPNLIATAAGNYTVTVTNNAGCSATSNPTTITVVSLAAPTITASRSSTICAGANLTLSTTASGPYQWKLNGAPISGGNSSSITVNASGVYSLTVNNASGCSANSNNLTITVVPLPTVSISANGPTVICQGSSVQLGAIASPGCTYQWKRNGIPQSNGQAATFMANNTGSYTVTVTNATGCQTTSNVLVVSQLQATLTALGSTTICQGSSVTLQATTGAGYTYQWIKNGQYALNPTSNASLTVTTSGTYKVEITTASGCVLMTNTIQVTVIQNPTATITATGSTTICSGSSMTLLVNNGGPNVTYQWKKNGVNIQNANGTSLTVTEAGIYTVAVANIACPTSSQVISNAITITVNPTPTPNINTTATTIPLGSSVTLFTTNVAGITYQWQKLNGNVWQNINGATNTSYSANTAGAYRVKATNSFGCSGYSSVVNLIMSQMPQIDDVVKSLPELNIALYPNPTNEVIYLDVPDTLIGQTYTILDINGRILFKETILEKTSAISVLNLARGTYWIQMENTQPLQFVKN